MWGKFSWEMPNWKNPHTKISTFSVHKQIKFPKQTLLDWMFTIINNVSKAKTLRLDVYTHQHTYKSLCLPCDGHQWLTGIVGHGRPGEVHHIDRYDSRLQETGSWAVCKYEIKDYTVDDFIFVGTNFVDCSTFTHSLGSKFVVIMFSFIIHTENCYLVGTEIRGLDPPRKLVPHEN